MDPEKILGEHATEFDPLNVSASDSAPAVADDNVFFSSSASATIHPQAEQNEVTIVPEVSVIPPLPTGRKTEENLFFAAEPEKTLVEPEKVVPSDTTSQPPSAPFIF
ncbi:hypothetical protein [Pseudomonas sp. CIP-10]|nr:hypothetical protein [Pseudomonas sp. CIP-10]UFH29755.1 hypothetical protein LMH93_28025 [Pseudomonas sp. CIP-10]